MYKVFHKSLKITNLISILIYTRCTVNTILNKSIVNYIVHKSRLQFPAMRYFNPFHEIPSFFHRVILILSSHLLRRLLSVPSLHIYPQTLCPPICHALYPFRPQWCHHSNTYLARKLFVFQFPNVPLLSAAEVQMSSQLIILHLLIYKALRQFDGHDFIRSDRQNLHLHEHFVLFKCLGRRGDERISNKR